MLADTAFCCCCCRRPSLHDFHLSSTFALFSPKRQSIKQASSLLPGDRGEERCLRPHFQGRASLEAKPERCRPAVHTCQVLCVWEQLGEVHMLMWVPPCGTVLKKNHLLPCNNLFLQKSIRFHGRLAPLCSRSKTIRISCWNHPC